MDFVSIVIIILSVSSFVQLCYFFCVYYRILKHQSQFDSEAVLFPVSVIISAKDEAENLQKFLPLILNQNYPEFEVIVVNDRSKNCTGQVLKSLKENFSNLIIADVTEKEPGINGKKNALTKGINISNYDYLVFTDADCYPVSENWLKEIVSTYRIDNELIIGYGGYKKQKGFLNKIIRYETLFNAMQYMSFALSGFPYMAVGRNLSYKKDVFVKNNGFKNHLNMMSGDDDLFLNEVGNKIKSTVVCNPESKTVSIPEKNFLSYLKQKKRHLSTGKYYKPVNKLLIGTEILSRFFFYLSLLILIFYKMFFLVLSVYAIRTIILIIFVKKFSERLKEKINLFFIPIFDILIPIINLFVFSGTFFDKNIRWK